VLYLEAPKRMSGQTHRELALADQCALGAMILEERALLVTMRPHYDLDLWIETTRQLENRPRLVRVRRRDDHEPRPLDVCVSKNGGTRRVAEDHWKPTLAQ
jgi:hypothetical protein